MTFKIISRISIGILFVLVFSFAMNMQARAGVNYSTALAKVENVKFNHKAALDAFYSARDDQPFWGRSFFDSRAQDFLALIDDSWTHGLNPERYHQSALQALMQDKDLTNLALRERLLTDAFISYVQDMSGMRVSAGGLHVDAQSFKQPPSAEEALDMMLRARDIESFLKSIAPKGRTYKLLQQELIRLSESEPEPYLDVMPLRFDRSLRPGERHTNVPALRKRLDVEPLTEDERVYDDRLAAAVMKFQRAQGLPDDGVIGAKTLQTLNRTNDDLILQIIANLERLRWVDEKRPDKYVVVNIPSATLWAIDGGEVEFEMTVIVGRPQRPTDSFITDITGIRFNPNWTVPPTIKQEDLLPKLQSNPEYFSNKGIEVFVGYGADKQTIDPAAIDWTQVSDNDLQSLRMVQSPGAHNALGRIRVLMPNRYNIYLHDTNEQGLFNKQARAVSSGCIRLSDPQKMASFIMRSKEGWSADSMDMILASNKTREQYIDHPIPVYILYYTSWVDEKGRIVYGTDIYGLDKALIQKLSRIDGFKIPSHNKNPG